MALWFSRFVIKQLSWPVWITNQFAKKLAMLLLPGIVLAMILALEGQYVGGIQGIVHVSESVSCDDDNFSSCRSGEGDNGSVGYVYKNCTCCSLDNALANLTSNVLINITTNATLSLLITKSDLYNVSIFGYNNPTIIFKMVEEYTVLSATVVLFKVSFGMDVVLTILIILLNQL